MRVQNVFLIKKQSEHQSYLYFHFAHGGELYMGKLLEQNASRDMIMALYPSTIA